MEGIRRSRLDSGLRVVTEALPELRSVTVGAWVGTGARDEADAEAGASHFLEHLLFKGTPERTAREIAEAVESVGGEMNAFTGHEQTAFYVRVPATQLDLAVEILSEVLWSPAFRPDELESERRVILEEIGMRDDTPDDLVHDLFARALFAGHPLGREVLGSAETVSAMSREMVGAYHSSQYRVSNVVIAAAGDVTHDALVARLGRLTPAREGDRPARPRPPLPEPQALAVIDRPTEQAHVVLGLRSLPALDPDRYALFVLNQALGGGMSSRLFQEVREQRGLAYSVYSYRGSYEETGMLAVYAGTSPARLCETLEVVTAELDRLVADGGLPERELEAAKGFLAGTLATSLETSASRMRRIGRSELVEGEVPTIDEVVARINAVTPDDVARVVARVLEGSARTLAVVGPVGDVDLEQFVPRGARRSGSGGAPVSSNDDPHDGSGR